MRHATVSSQRLWLAVAVLLLTTLACGFQGGAFGPVPTPRATNQVLVPLVGGGAPQGSTASEPALMNVTPLAAAGKTSGGKAESLLITAPSAFTAVTGAAHWDVLIRARAIETQCYILAAAQGGTHPGPRETYGHAAIVDPWGRVLAQQDQGEAVLLAERDSSEQASIRARMPVSNHRRLFLQDALRPVHTSE